MISRVIENPPDVRTDRQYISIGMSLEENRFATVPMRAARPLRTGQSELEREQFATVPMEAVRSLRTERRELEEEWHTSFEQAISERAARVSEQLRHLSTTALDRAVPATDVQPAAPRSPLARACHFWRERKRGIVLFCLGFGLFLAGFDLMGLLVLLR
jgi:hypothetical protein